MARPVVLVCTAFVGDEFFEQSSIRDDGLAEILGRGIAAGGFRVDVVTGAVVLHDIRMIDGNQGEVHWSARDGSQQTATPAC